MIWLWVRLQHFGRFTLEVDVMFPIGVVVLTVALAPLSVSYIVSYNLSVTPVET